MESPISRAQRGFTEHPMEHDISELHIHALYEVFCVVSGEVEYHVEGSVYYPKPGDILLTKKAEAHFIRCLSDKPYERIWLYFNEGMIVGSQKNELIRFLDERSLGQGNYFPCARWGQQWQYYLEKICSTISRAKRQLYFSVLLSELQEARRSTADVSPSKGSGVIADIVNYINLQLTTPLSVEMLCKKYFISRAQLNRKFKKLTGCSVWEYITDKRLMLAQDLICKGNAPTIACTKSGFNDYTAFYRAYKKKFGVSPKAHKHST